MNKLLVNLCRVSGDSHLHPCLGIEFLVLNGHIQFPSITSAVVPKGFILRIRLFLALDTVVWVLECWLTGDKRYIKKRVIF